MTTEQRDHWEQVYRTKQPDAVSWYQREARLSREIIGRVATNRDAHVVDVGAGASVLVDGLLADGYRHITVLDISSAALEVARARLGNAAATVTWCHADVLTASLAADAFDVWHDRAVFHFLTDAAKRAQYLEQVRKSVRRGGHVVMATFAEDGPLKCSGLETCRYSADALRGLFGDEFTLIESYREEHVTPSGSVQAFTYAVFRR